MNALVKADEFDTMQRVSMALYKSGYFSDVKSEAQAIVKVMAGAELGLQPFASMTGIHIINNKPVLSSNVIATLVKNDPRYNYKVERADDQICQIVWFENGVNVGSSFFTIKEAAAAGLTGKQVWKAYPSDMLFARAISRGARRFAPGIFGGSPVYTPDEMGVDVDPDGYIEGEIISNNGTGPEPEIVKAQLQQEVDEINEAMAKEHAHALGADYDDAPPVDFADVRAWLEDKIRDGRVNLGLVADAIGMIGFTPDDDDGIGNRKHIANWLNSADCKDLRDTGLKIDYRKSVTAKGAFTIFDRAVEHMTDEEE